MNDSITQEQVDKIRALAEAVTGDCTLYDMHYALDPETVRQLCNGWEAWANYQ